MSRMLQHGEQVLVTLWVGSLWAIGYLAVPTLFAALDDRMLAGMLAGKMFTAVSFIGLGCGTALLAMAVMASPRFPKDRRVLLLGLMLLLVLIGEFVLQPAMAELKAQGLVEGSGAAARFGLLHGVASLLYLLNSICGLLLLLLTGREPVRLKADE
jgi:hypothetical protein